MQCVVCIVMDDGTEKVMCLTGDEHVASVVFETLVRQYSKVILRKE